MRIEYDREVDALYIRLQEKYVARTIEVEEGLNLDLDDNGKLIGLEVLDATERYSLADIFNISTENLILGEKPIKEERLANDKDCIRSEVKRIPDTIG
jgi:uncharacterized protein YuzE